MRLARAAVVANFKGGVSEGAVDSRNRALGRSFVIQGFRVRLVPGVPPGGGVTFFCCARRKSPKKRR
jgi:hypothetical protein